MQEIMLAFELTVCGSKNMVDWEQVLSWLWQREGPSRETEAVMRDNNDQSLWLWPLLSHREHTTKASPITLLEAIYKFFNRRCLDSRGKVYGLLRMICSDERIEVQYTVSLTAVLYFALRKIMEVEAELKSCPITREFTGLDFSILASEMGLRRTKRRRIGDFIMKFRKNRKRLGRILRRRSLRK